MAAIQDKAFGQQLQRLETLIHEIESFTDPAAQTAAREAIQGLMDLHGAALERMMETVAEAGAAGEAIIERCAADEAISGLLLLYGLHPLDLEARVMQALDKVRPYLRLHGGNVELLSVAAGTVRLRLAGSCHGCPSSAITLKLAIEEALYAAAPDVTALEVEGVVEPPAASSGFIPLELVCGFPSAQL